MKPSTIKTLDIGYKFDIIIKLHENGNKLPQGQLALSFVFLCKETEEDASCSFSNVGRAESPQLYSLVQQHRRAKTFGFRLGFNSFGTYKEDGKQECNVENVYFINVEEDYLIGAMVVYTLSGEER